MLNKKAVSFPILVIAAAVAVFFVAPQEARGADDANLAVPFTSEIPNGQWVGPWKNACEEATFAMVENYYLGNRSISIADAKNYMQRLFNFQDRVYGSNADADSWRSVYIITKQTHFRAKVVQNPTVDDIKKELQQKRPVITLHHGFSLQNKNIPFLATGSSFHVMPVIGYDDATQEFIVNDPGDRYTGKEHRYSYDLFMKTLHDFDFNKRQASGPPRVLFTYPKLVQAVNSSTVYYLQDNYRYPITTTSIFKKYGWKEEGIVVVDSGWLEGFMVGEEMI